MSVTSRGHCRRSTTSSFEFQKCHYTSVQSTGMTLCFGHSSPGPQGSVHQNTCPFLLFVVHRELR